MKKELIDIIKNAVAHCDGIPSAVIEYNFELPKHKDIKKDSFFGVKAKFEKNVKVGSVQVTLKYNG